MTTPNIDNEKAFIKLARFFQSTFSMKEKSYNTKELAAEKLSTQELKNEINLKILVVGGHGVGKTTIIRRWANKPYVPRYTTTIGVDKTVVSYEYQEHKINLHIWDVSSKEVDSPMDHFNLLCTGVAGIFVVFNVNRISTITAVDAWREKLGKYVSSNDVPWILLSHKADLIEERVMTSDDVDAYCMAGGYSGWFWTVGRTGFGDSEKKSSVSEALRKMVSKICERPALHRLLLESTENATETLDSLKIRTLHKEWYTAPALPTQLVTSDSVIDQSSASILRLPTVAITTQPRDHEKTKNGNVPATTCTGESTCTAGESTCTAGESTSGVCDYGAAWMLGRGQGLELNPNLEPNTSTQVYPENKISQDNGWKHFAGTIDRQKAEEYLKKDGTFLLRRKSPSTLILSFKSSNEVRHTPIEYTNKCYSMGVKGKAFPSLDDCLKQVKKEICHGLYFVRRPGMRYTLYQPCEQEEECEESSPSVIEQNNLNGQQSRNSSSKSPKVGHWCIRGSIGTDNLRGFKKEMESSQSHVDIPNASRIYALSNDFYDQMDIRLQKVLKNSVKTRKKQIVILLEQVNLERERISMDPRIKRALEGSEETQNRLQFFPLEDIWRGLVQDMEIWKRITQNLEAELLVLENTSLPSVPSLL